MTNVIRIADAQPYSPYRTDGREMIDETTEIYWYLSGDHIHIGVNAPINIYRKMVHKIAGKELDLCQPSSSNSDLNSKEQSEISPQQTSAWRRLWRRLSPSRKQDG